MKIQSRLGGTILIPLRARSPPEASGQAEGWRDFTSSMAGRTFDCHATGPSLVHSAPQKKVREEELEAHQKA